MEFGRIDKASLIKVDYTLPPDPELTIQTLREAKNHEPLQVRVGCAKWGRKEWRGKIYPPKTKEANFLNEYVKHFDCIELNATFYDIYTPDEIEQWKLRAAANPNFRFCPKFSQSISHYRRLKNTDEITTRFYEGIMAFGEQLGPLFLQMGNNYTPKNLPDLRAYLEGLPKDVTMFLELRHKDWFGVPEIRHSLFNMLRELKIGSVITDTPGRRDVIHMELPTPHAFIRFVGNNLHPTDYTRVDEWVERIKQWQQMGLKSVWFFMHQHDERYSPELADYVAEQLNKQLGLDILRPQFMDRDKLSEPLI